MKLRPIAIVSMLMVSSGLAAMASISCAVDVNGPTEVLDDRDATPHRDAAVGPGDDPDSGSEDPNEPAIRVTAGTQTTCTMQRDGTVQCWGFNTYGEFGDGTSGAASAIATTATGLSAKQLAAGNQHQCALTMDDQVMCWGTNKSLQLGHDVTLDGDGGPCAPAIPCNRSPVAVVGTSAATEVTAGSTFSCARTGGSVACWGTGSLGEIGEIGSDTSSVSPNAISISGVDSVVSGFTFSCAHKAADGTIWCWGRRQFGEIGRSADLDGGAPAWDEAKHPVPQAVAGLADTLAVAAGPNHACVIQQDKTVSCWGLSRLASSAGGQLGHDPASDPLCKNGGYCNDKPTKVAGLANVRELALGIGHSCALMDDDTVACWGQNDLGRLGHDPATDSDAGDAGPTVAAFTPKPVDGLSDVAHISSRYTHTCAVTHASKVYCWGANESGELGQVARGSSFTPVEVQGL